MRFIFFFLLVLIFIVYSCGGSFEVLGEVFILIGILYIVIESVFDVVFVFVEVVVFEFVEMAWQLVFLVVGFFEEKLMEGFVFFIVEFFNSSLNYFILNIEGMSVCNEEIKMEVNGVVVCV